MDKTTLDIITRLRGVLDDPKNKAQAGIFHDAPAFSLAPIIQLTSDAADEIERLYGIIDECLDCSRSLNND
jgi:hypothetical protein